MNTWRSSVSVCLSAQCRSSSTSRTGDVVGQHRDARRHRLQAACSARSRHRSTPGSRMSGKRRRSSGTSSDELGPMALGSAARPGRRRAVLDEMGDGLDPWLVGDAQLLVAPAVEHDRPLAVRLDRQLGGQAGLADAGFAGEERDASFPGGRCLEGLVERIGLFRPDRRAARSMSGRRRSGTAMAASGAGPAPTRTVTDGTGSGTPRSSRSPIDSKRVIGLAGHHRGELAGDDLPGLALRAQASRLDDRLAEVVAVLLGRVTGGDPDPDAERFVAARQLCRSIACCMATPPSSADVRLGNTTISPSPRFFTSVPPWASIALREQAEVHHPQASAALRAQSRRHLGRPHEIGEDHVDADEVTHRPTPVSP